MRRAASPSCSTRSGRRPGRRASRCGGRGARTRSPRSTATSEQPARARARARERLGAARRGGHSRQRARRTLARARERVAVPGDRPLEALAERRPRAEAEQLARPARRRASAAAGRSASTCPSAISPSKPGQLGDELGQLADRVSDAGAEVDRLGAVVALGREQQALGAVVDVEELARRRAVAPEHDLARVAPRASCGSAPGSRATSSRSKLSRGP